MKPLNLDNRPCSPISSNCVIWQGPDIPCIKLCAGDTVSDVVAKLGTELCTILDQLDVSTYDLSCLNLSGCAPADFHGLIQLLITKICEANGISTPTDKSATVSGCPDCVVSVAPCLVQNGQTTMQLVDYVQLIANKVCSILDQITVINNQITNLDTRVTVLENTPPPTFTLPSIEVDCTLKDSIIVGGNIYPIDQVLDALVNDDIHGYCALLSATGQPADLLSAVATQCISSTDPSLANPGVNMGTAYFGSWVNTPFTVSDAITNLWLSVCDMYNYLQTNQLTVVDTNTVNLTYSGGTLQADVQDTGWVQLNGFGYYTSGMVSERPECRRIGNVIHFRGLVVVPLSSTANGLTLVSYNSGTAYNDESVPYTYGNAAGTLPNGTKLDANGAVKFNNDSSCIPASVWSGNLDNTYALGWIIATRQINLTASYGAALSATLSVTISSTGVLSAVVIKDLELSSVRGDGMRGTTQLRMINTNIRSGEVIPNYINTATDIQNLPGAGVSNLVASSQFTSETSTPVASLTWPFSCDTGEETEIGGFAFRLDGLTAFVDPCAATVPTPSPC